MSEDYRDKIQEIRARRRGNTQSYQTPTPGTPGGPSAYELSPSIGQNRVAPSLGVNIAQQQVQSTESILGPDFKSPWLKDRVTLSLEGQIAMMELRSSNRVSNVDLGYTNRIPILPIRPGIYVKVEPPGTYRLQYHYR